MFCESFYGMRYKGLEDSLLHYCACFHQDGGPLACSLSFYTESTHDHIH